MTLERLSQQINFVLEIDQLKQVFRQTILLTGNNRAENDAEHSWHLAMAALLLSEHSNDKNLDLFKVIKMVLIHDLVEIDAGDTFCYDTEAVKEQAKNEREAAERIFGLLPSDQSEQFWVLWEEFNAMITPEARFAAALDRLQPLLHNIHTKGGAWKKHGVTKAQVVKRNGAIANGSKLLWEYAKNLIDEAVHKGYLADDAA